MTPYPNGFAPISWLCESERQTSADIKRQEAMNNLARRREQKLLNAVGAHLNKETLAIEDIISLNGRMRAEINAHDQSESFYLDDTLLVTFLQPEFIADGDAIMVKQGYGPVGV